MAAGLPQRSLRRSRLPADARVLRAAAGARARPRRSRAHRSGAGTRHADPAARRCGSLLPRARGPPMIETGSAPPANVEAEPRRPIAERFGRLRRRLPFGGRRVIDDAVRLPTVMTFVVAMFAATMALVSFGYMATREWRSGTNLLLERRANEALALVRAALSADMKGAWITAIVPFNTTVLDEEPPYGLFQVAARAFARFPYPESFILWKCAAQGD